MLEKELLILVNKEEIDYEMSTEIRHEKETRSNCFSLSDSQIGKVSL